MRVAAGEYSIAVVTAGGQARLTEAPQTHFLTAVPVGKCWVAAVRLAAVPQAARRSPCAVLVPINAYLDIL